MSQQFDIFAQLVATGNIGTSARMLELPTSEIVETMNRLEDQMGFQIFEVAGGIVELTDAGRKVVHALGEFTLDESEAWANAVTDPPSQQHRAVFALADASEPAAITVNQIRTEPEDNASPVERNEERSYEERNAQTDAVSSAQAAPLRARDSVADAPPDPKQAIEPTRTITLASHPAIFSHFQEALVAFEEASPDIGIELRLESVSEQTAERLLDEGLADIAYFYALEESEHFASRYAWSERISLFVSSDHPLAVKDAVMADDLSKLAYAALAPTNSARPLSEQALKREGLIVQPPALETDDLYKLMKYIEGNSAYLAAFGPIARDFGRMNGIRRLSYAQGLPQVQVRQAIAPKATDDPAVMALAEFLFR